MLAARPAAWPPPAPPWAAAARQYRRRSASPWAWPAAGLLLAGIGGVTAAAGHGELACLGMAGLASVALGAQLPMVTIRGLVLAALLLVPDAPSGQSWGLAVRWSQGLTWSNFVVPALALPLLAGAWLAGRRLTPARWPGLARWCMALLAWCWLTLLLSGSTAAAPVVVTLVAHLVKLTLFLWLGVVLASGEGAWARIRDPLLLLGIAANAIFGLGQAAGWLPVFSPLAQQQAGLGIRVSGLFYDANMYGVLAAWALLWLLATVPGATPRWRAAGWVLTAAVAGNLVATGSRAGYLALAAGGLVLAWRGQGRAVARGMALLLVLACLFPVRSWQRIQAAAATLASDAQPRDVAPAGGQDAGTQQRLDSMAEAWRQIERHPLLGLGFGRALYAGVPAIGQGGPVRPARDITFNGAQNMGLTVLAETGPVGLVLFFLAIADPLRGLRARPPAPGLPILAGYVGLLAACFTIEALWNTRLLALVVMLVAIAAQATAAREVA